jgi:hypothetical protein
MLVRESISFERGVDPKVSLGIGEYNFSYEQWEYYVKKVLLRYIVSSSWLDAMWKWVIRNKTNIMVYNKHLGIAESAKELYRLHFGKTLSSKNFELSPEDFK